MRFLGLCFLLLSVAGSATELETIETLPYQQRAALVETFLTDHPHNPVDGVIYYRGPGHALVLAGDFTDWKPTAAMEHVPGTGLWRYVTDFPADARVDYKIVRDGQWILDPRNPRQAMGGFGANSEFQGIDYRLPDWVNRTDLPSCSFDTLSVHSPELGDTRTVVVVTPPPGPSSAGAYLLVHDGLEYIDLAGLAGALGRLRELNPNLSLPTCICVPPVRRTEEYATSLQTRFGDFIVQTLLPLIESRYGACGRWGTMGASYGGRISLHLAHRYPDQFDRVIAMSPSISDQEQAGVGALDPDQTKLYVNWGTYDIQRLIPGCEAFVAMLAERGFDHQVQVLAQGHAWGFWRDTLVPALEFVYGD